MKKTAFYLSLVLIGFLVLGCDGRSRVPNIELIQDMFVSPAIKAQDEDPNSMKVPPENTIPKGFEPYPYATAEEAGAKLKSPITFDEIAVQEGQKHYMNYCFVCHGATGDGLGPMAKPWPSPIPNMLTERMRQYPDGHIYHIITKGRGLMSSYAYQVKPEMRWQIIAYLRHLQKNSKVLPDTGAAN